MFATEKCYAFLYQYARAKLLLKYYVHRTPRKQKQPKWVFLSVSKIFENHFFQSRAFTLPLSQQLATQIRTLQVEL